MLSQASRTPELDSYGALVDLNPAHRFAQNQLRCSAFTSGRPDRSPPASLRFCSRVSQALRRRDPRWEVTLDQEVLFTKDTARELQYASNRLNTRDLEP